MTQARTLAADRATAVDDSEFFTYESGRDSLAREDGWRYVAAITVAYLLSRGLAKVGSYEKSEQ